MNISLRYVFPNAVEEITQIVPGYENIKSTKSRDAVNQIRAKHGLPPVKGTDQVQTSMEELEEAILASKNS